MKIKYLFLALSLLVSTHNIAQGKPLPVPAIAELTYSVEFVLDYVLAKKKLVRDPDILPPELFLQSTTTLDFFQESIKDQWGFVPDVYTNAYDVSTNRIFLSDDKSYYDKMGRCLDDSLAHEVTHYVQVKYQNWSLDDESLEWDAIDIQTQFREDFCTKHENSSVSKVRY